MAKKSRKISTCGSCGKPGHKSSTCQSVESITLKWEKFTSFADFKKDQYLLSPVENTSKPTKVGGKRETLKFGKCQGWYSLESHAGVHYIGLVGEVSSITKIQSQNSFYERWLGHYTDLRRGWHDKGGFGEGKNGTWPSGHMKDGKLLSNEKYQLLISKVNNIALDCKNKTMKEKSKTKYIDPGIEQAALITNVEQYMIHRYANNPATRKFDKNTPSILVNSKGTKVSFKPDKEILFNTSNTTSINKTPPNIRAIISPETGINRSHLCELNDEKRTMNHYKKTYKNDSKKLEATDAVLTEKAAEKKAAGTRKKKAAAKKATKKAAAKKATKKVAEKKQTKTWAKGYNMNPYANKEKAKNGRNKKVRWYKTRAVVIKLEQKDWNS